MRHKEHNPRGNRVRRVFRDEITRLDPRRNKFTEFRQFGIDIQAAAVAVNKGERCRMAQRGFLIIIHFVFEFIDNRAGVFTATRSARIVEMKDGRNFFRRPRAIVVPRCNVNGRRNDAVPIIPTKRLDA